MPGGSGDDLREQGSHGARGAERRRLRVEASTGHLLHKTRIAGVWSDWTDRGAGPGGHPVGTPAITSPGPGRLEIVARDLVTNDLLRWAFFGAWNGPLRVAATPGGAYTPSIESWALGRLDVFAVTNTGRLSHLYIAGAGWSRWESLGAGPGGQPYGHANAVTSWEPRRLDVFAPSADERALLHRWFDGTGWRGPETLATGTGPDRIPLRGIAAAAWAPGRLDVFSTDAHTHGLTHTWYNGRWNGPERLDFAGPTQTVLADPDPRTNPIPVDARVFEHPGD